MNNSSRPFAWIPLTGNNFAAPLTTDLGNDDLYLQPLSTYATAIGSRPAVRCWITPTPWCLAKDYSLHARKWLGTACHRDHRCPTAGTCQADRQSLADQRPAQLRNLQQLGPGGGRQFRRNHSSKWRGNNSGYAGLHVLGGRMPRARHRLYLPSDYLRRRNGRRCHNV